MNDFFTVLTFSYAHEAEIAKGMLEAEGIECNIRDALTTQVNPLYSNAIGGVKLQVRMNSINDAVQILQEAGYTIGNIEPDWATRLDTATAGLPLLGGIRFEIRLVVLVIVVVLALLGLASLFINKP